MLPDDKAGFDMSLFTDDGDAGSHVFGKTSVPSRGSFANINGITDIRGFVDYTLLYHTTLTNTRVME